MNYKIHTVPIIDAYKLPACECPMCEIERHLEQRAVDTYLHEAVMEPDARTEVNKTGFCANHLDMLFAGDNACGLALQAQTRMETLRRALVRPTDAKKAIKESARIHKQISGCVICSEIADTMERYYLTTASMFLHEAGFSALLRKSYGHCMRHYASLLKFASHAGKQAPVYVDVLYNLQFASLTRLDLELTGYINKFDAAKRSLPCSKQSADSLPRVIDKLK